MKSNSHERTGLFKLMKKTKRYGCTLLSVLLLTQAGTSWALSTDREQPIRIVSDSADIDDKSGIAIYKGSVVMTQGTTQLTGDIVTIKSQNRTVSEVIAVGKQAHYKEQQDGDQGEIKSWGNTIHYYIDKEKVVLLESARVEQKEDVVKGKRIDYDMKTQRISAQSDRKGSEGDRVEMLFQPKTTPESAPKG